MPGPDLLCHAEASPPEHGGAWASEPTSAEASYARFRRNAPAPPALGGAHPAERVSRQLKHQYRLIRALEPGVIAGLDPEFLHQYRVNLRRSRAIGESVLAVVKVPGLKGALRGLKRRAQATSDLRDLDVFLASLAEHQTPLAPTAQPALQRWLSARREAAHQALCEQLSQDAYAEEMHAWRAFLSSKGFRKPLRKLTSKRVQAVLAKRLTQHNRDLASLTAASPDGALHELRKGVKRIRYLSELHPKRHRELLARLKQRQTLLGEFQDLCTWQAWIAGFVGELGDAPAQRAECDRWLAELEQQKQALRQRIMDLPPCAL